MSSFTTEPKITLLHNEKSRWGAPLYQVNEEFEFHVGSYPSLEIIKINKGFVSDGASIPPIFWSILPPWHPHYGKAAIVHDYLWDNSKNVRDRRRATYFFNQAMRVLGCPFWKRIVMTLSVVSWVEIKNFIDSVKK